MIIRAIEENGVDRVARSILILIHVGMPFLSPTDS